MKDLFPRCPKKVPCLHSISLSRGEAVELNRLLKKPLLGASGVSTAVNKLAWANDLRQANTRNNGHKSSQVSLHCSRSRSFSGKDSFESRTGARKSFRGRGGGGRTKPPPPPPTPMSPAPVKTGSTCPWDYITSSTLPHDMYILAMMMLMTLMMMMMMMMVDGDDDNDDAADIGDNADDDNDDDDEGNEKGYLDP